MVTVPPLYLKETGLTVGSTVSLEIKGDELKIRPTRKRITLSDVIKGTPKEVAALRAEDWDTLKPAGRER